MNRKIITFIISSLISGTLLAGGGWTSKKGNGYYKLGQSILISDQLFDQKGNETDITTTGVFITSIYGEHGITDRLEAMVQVPLFFRTTINEVRFRSEKPGIPGDEFNSYGDPSLGFKYGLLTDQSLVLAASVRFDFPLGKTDGGDSKIIQTGDGEFNQLIKLDMGYAENENFYFSAGVGFNNRTEDFSDEIHSNVEAGFQLSTGFWAILKANRIDSRNNGHASDNASGIFSNNMEQFVVTPQLAYMLESNIGFSGSMAYPLSGQNILKAPIYEASIFYRVSK